MILLLSDHHRSILGRISSVMVSLRNCVQRGGTDKLKEKSLCHCVLPQTGQTKLRAAFKAVCLPDHLLTLLSLLNKQCPAAFSRSSWV